MNRNIAIFSVLLGIAVISVATSLNKLHNSVTNLKQKQAETIKLIFNFEQLKNDFMYSKAKYIVKITNQDNDRGGTGTIVNTPSGTAVILTNNHICNLAENGELLIDGRYNAHILARYKSHDLCILNSPLMSFGLTIADKSYQGQNITILGHPMLEPTSLVKGTIAGPTIVRIRVDDPVCQGEGFEKIDVRGSLFQVFFNVEFLCIRSYLSLYVTANILPGNSGSPVLNDSGELVGVAFAGTDGSASGFIVPLPFIKDFLKDM